MYRCLLRVLWQGWELQDDDAPRHARSIAFWSELWSRRTFGGSTRCKQNTIKPRTEYRNGRPGGHSHALESRRRLRDLHTSWLFDHRRRQRTDRSAPARRDARGSHDRSKRPACRRCRKYVSTHATSNMVRIASMLTRHPGPRERHLETLLHSTLRTLILVRSIPRTLVQITLQVRSLPEEDSTTGLNTVRLHQKMRCGAKLTCTPEPNSPPPPPAHGSPRPPLRLNTPLHNPDVRPRRSPVFLTTTRLTNRKGAPARAAREVSTRLCLLG
jgi:hypothetical protein